jgi:hypothetical protein
MVDTVQQAKSSAFAIYFLGPKDRRYVCMRTRRSKRTAIVGSIALVGAALGLAQPVTAASKMASAYVKVDDANCKKVAGNDDEDWATLRCGKPVGGWTVYVEYGDVRESIALKRAGRSRINLKFYAFHGSFSSVGPVLEFRTRNGVPISAVIRMTYSIDPDDSSITASSLMVSKLSPSPCVVADVGPGANQSALARSAADQAPSLACLDAPS